MSGLPVTPSKPRIESNATEDEDEAQTQSLTPEQRGRRIDQAFARQLDINRRTTESLMGRRAPQARRYGFAERDESATGASRDRMEGPPPPTYEADGFPAIPLLRSRSMTAGCLHGTAHDHVFYRVVVPRAWENADELGICVGDILEYVRAHQKDEKHWFWGSHLASQGRVPWSHCDRLTSQEVQLLELAMLRPAAQANRENWNLLPDERVWIGAGQKLRRHRGLDHPTPQQRQEEQYWNTDGTE